MRRYCSFFLFRKVLNSDNLLHCLDNINPHVTLLEKPQLFKEYHCESDYSSNGGSLKIKATLFITHIFFFLLGKFFYLWEALRGLDVKGSFYSYWKHCFYFILFKVMQRQFLRTGVVLGSFKLDVATIMAQQGKHIDVATIMTQQGESIDVATIMAQQGKHMDVATIKVEKINTWMLQPYIAQQGKHMDVATIMAQQGKHIDVATI